MKALSMRQPWATLIVAGAPIFKAVDSGDGSQRVEFAGMYRKDIENRTRPTNIRGRIYVHASRRRADFEECLRYLGERGISPLASMVLSSPRYAPTGVILGEVDIVDCVTESKSPWFTGPYGWVLSNPVLYEKPLPCKGKLGFFEPKLPLTPTGEKG